MTCLNRRKILKIHYIIQIYTRYKYHIDVHKYIMHSFNFPPNRHTKNCIGFRCFNIIYLQTKPILSVRLREERFKSY